MNPSPPAAPRGLSHDAAPACDFCGLPLKSTARDDGEAAYCCYGCRFAASLVSEGSAGDAGRGLTRLGIAVFFAMSVMVFTLVLWSQPAESDPLAAAWYDAARYACLLFTTPVVLLLGAPLLGDAWREWKAGRPSLNWLLLAGVAGALGYSIHSLLVGKGHVYFEVASAVLVFTTLGRWLEAEAKLKTTAALRGLAQLLPDQVRVLRGDVEHWAAAAAVAPGDVVRILPGERIAVDGVVVTHSAAIDEQAVTGESMPAVKRPGDAVASGTLVLDGPLDVQATAAVGDGTMARMIAAVAEATAASTRYDRLVVAVSRWFLPFVGAAALATFASHGAAGAVGAGLLSALAVLVIACPCALGLATPMAIWAAIGRAAEAGVLIRDGDALPLLAGAQTICFDKTGTLTTGVARAVELSTDPATERSVVLDVARTLARYSTHPLAIALARSAGETAHVGRSWSPSSVRTFPGRGLSGRLEGIDGTIRLGARAWLEESNAAAEWVDECPVDCAETCVAWGGRIRGVFHFEEELRPQAAATVRDLRRAGLRQILLTGDRATRADAVASQLAIEGRGNLTPEDKLAVIRACRASGPVVMIGDGLNDAPALAAADVGIALGSGTDIARHSAGVCLLGNDLSRVPWLLGLARATVRTIRWNLFWACAYNVIGVGLAAAGWVHPILAAIAMTASGLFVATHSLALTRFPASEPPATLEYDASPAVGPALNVLAPSPLVSEGAP